jgi:hypothetical protein
MVWKLCQFTVDFSLVSLVTLECDILHFIEKIEKMCENLGIAYQSCYPLQRKGSLKSLACKIEHKVLPLCCDFCLLQYYHVCFWFINQVVKHLVLVRDARTIIFGADMVQGEGFEYIASVFLSTS